MRKGRNGENGEEKKIITFLVATNVVVSRPPEHRPTGMPTALANCHDTAIQMVTKMARAEKWP